MKTKYKIRSKVWLYPGMSGWHFVGLPKKESGQIKKIFGVKTKGWGSIPVSVMLGKSKWNTSIFPDKRSGTYLLPLKAKVRKDERVFANDIITIVITINA